MQTRYGTDRVTPGNRPPEAEIKRFDQSVQDDWNRLQTRRRELSARLKAVNSEVGQIKINRAAFIVEGCEYQKLNQQLIDLKSEAEGLQDALDYICDKAGLLKRSNR
jgi:chromosome segregation ATPase